MTRGTIDDIQAEIDGKHRLLADSQIRRRIYLILAATHAAAFWFPGWIFLVAGLAWAFLLYVESLGLVREISKLAKRRAALEEQVEGFIQDRGDAIRRRMAQMLAVEARERARRNGSLEMFKGNCIDISDKP